MWATAAYDRLAAPTLYEILRLRAEVFVVEQRCAFQDLDGFDDLAMHLMGHADGALVAYARCFEPGVTFAEASIGRIVTRGTARGGGLGHLLVQRALRLVCDTWGAQPVRIGAQARLQAFYAGHGFVDQGRPYVEDGIDHLEMLWKPEPGKTE